MRDRIELDAKTAHLDLVVQAAQVFELSIGGPAAQVAGAEHQATFAQKGVGAVALGRQFGVGHIAAGDAVTATPHFANFADGAGLQILVQHVHRVVGRGPAYGQRLGLRRVVLHGVDDGDFGGAAGVVEAALGRPLVGQGLGAGFSRQGHHLHLAAAAGVYAGQNRGGGNDGVHLLGHFLKIAAPYHQGRTVRERTQYFPGGHVKTNVEQLRHFHARAQPQIAGAGQHDIGHVAVTYLHTVGRAGGAGGEQHKAEVVGLHGLRGRKAVVSTASAEGLGHEVVHCDMRQRCPARCCQRYLVQQP